LVVPFALSHEIIFYVWIGFSHNLYENMLVLVNSDLYIEGGN